MAKLEDLQAGTRVNGLAPGGVAQVKAVEWFGEQCVQVTYVNDAGQAGQALLYRDDEPRLKIEERGRLWSFDADGDLLRLVSEAYRIHLAWLFDPYLAISTSTIDPLPHQISAVYEEMLPRQPLRFLLADDPGAGKTIMAGLFIKELLVRGDMQRCLIISPGSLTEQWQDELKEKFDLDFEILTRDMIQASRTSNPFEHKNCLIARLDQLSRNEDIQERLQAAPEWDLVVCDEAHRMSAHFFGGEIKETKRYKLGRTVGSHCRNFLLMTATPHNGKEEDFQLFLALLDGDRFAGRFRDGVHTAEPGDMMRRLVKEDLKRFDGRPLFPERKSYTVQYALSDPEAYLYTEVTDYVREEMNRAERFVETDDKRRVNVGFALMTLQRRLASSPEAIFRSIERRRERLESRLREERIRLRSGKTETHDLNTEGPNITEEEWDEIDEELPDEEREDLEQQLVDHATAARTVEELVIEIGTLENLEKRAKAVRDSGTDAKWNQLTQILDDPLMVDEDGNRRKLLIFTEFKDTLLYLAKRIRVRLGKQEAVEVIHGGVTREDRRRVVHRFMNDPDLLVLVANDAAGEGVNLQRAHLMVNYDLPWNPNRLEQRFGRIHRIGQKEVCHLWNLVAKDTREGDVYVRLLQKLEQEREALGGKVFDVLGDLFEQESLRHLLVEAIRYGNRPDVKARLDQAVDNATERKHIEGLLQRRALVRSHMDMGHVDEIRAEMERAAARRLQPHFIQSFFREAFAHLGGKLHRRESERYEVTHVPQGIRDRDRLIGTGAPVLRKYERVCFDKRYVDQQPTAMLVAPGNPLLDCTIDLLLESYRGLLKQGAVLVDDGDGEAVPRLLFYLEHSVQDGRRLPRGGYQVISRHLQFVEVSDGGTFRDAGMAPYLDYRAASEAECAALGKVLDADWLKDDWENQAMGFALKTVVPKHVDEVRKRRLPLIDKVEQQVKSRLQKEVNFWDRRAQDLKAQEAAGKKTRLPSQVALDRANRMADRLKMRLESLELERMISPQPPRVIGGALIVPAGLLRKLGVAPPDTRGAEPPPSEQETEDKKRIEMLAMEAVMKAERALGREPRDVSDQNVGYDIESKDPATGDLRFIEVKGRAHDAANVVLTRNEILRALNVPERWVLGVVLVKDEEAAEPFYVREFDWGQPSFATTHVTFAMKALKAQGRAPR